MSDVLIRQTKVAGHITLNRPQALNALTHQMCLDIEAALDQWAGDASIKCVVIDAAGERAFCTGGDIVNMYRGGIKGDIGPLRQFWRDEYRLNAKIATYPKPYVAFTHGYTMGGGVGVSAHGSHWIVTDSTRFAMPECAIGLIPDVGGTKILSEMEGSLGMWAGLTGARITGKNCVALGMAMAYLPEDAFSEVKEKVLTDGDVSVLDGPSPALDLPKDEINAVFGLGSVDEILAALGSADGEWADWARKGVAHAAPLSLLATKKLIEMAKGHGIQTALRNEYRYCSMAALDGEFLEGVRAALIDKDRNPQWRFKTLADVPSEQLERLMEPAADGDFEYKEAWQ